METDGINEGRAKRMRLRFAGVCRLCGGELAAHREAIYEPDTKTVRCVTCATGAGVGDASPASLVAPIRASAVDSGVAGSSARREYERRKARDEQHLRDKWGRFGGIAVALSDDRQTTQAWERGAVGEELLGSRLDSWASDQLSVLHDRRIPGTTANIDHIIVTTSGVWVVDAKRYTGRPELRVEGGILRPRVERLVVGRRDCTKLVDAVLKQVGLVREVIGDIPVTGALCFVEADWPLIGGTFSTRGVHVVWPKRLRKVINDGGVGTLDVAATKQTIATHFPPS